MAKTTGRLNYQEQVALAFKNRAGLIAEQIASALGPPSNSVNIPLEQEIKMWNTRQMVDPQSGQPIDPDALLSQGVPVEQIVDMVYPLRNKMTKFGRPNPSDQVKYAERMARYSEEGYNPEGE